jgi:hypothetical protein
MTTDPMPTTIPATDDALGIIRDDHRAIDESLAELKLVVSAQPPDEGAADRAALLQRAGALMRAHARIELEVFYPALEDAGAVLDEVRRDKRELLSRLDALVEMAPADPSFGLRLAALIGSTRVHAATEESQLFPLARSLDIETLGAKMAQRRAQMLGDRFTH